MPDRSRFASVDLVLAVLALLGVALLIGRLPAEHPVSAASYALGPSGAIEAAESFLVEHGYSTEGLEPAAFFFAHAKVLDDLQNEVGRREALAALQRDAAASVPAFYWMVQWHATEDDQPGAPRYVVRLTQDGTPWYFRNRAGMAQDGLDRTMLDEALGPLDGSVSDRVGPDSALAALLRFEVPDEGIAGTALNDSLLVHDRESREAAATLAQPQRLSAASAAALAQAHAGTTLLAQWPMEVVRVAPVPDRGRGARVMLRATEPILGRRLVAQADVAAGGALLDLRTRFDVDPNDFDDQPGADGEFGNGLSFDLLGDTLTGVKMITWALIAVLIVVFFIRRLRLRALDTQAALVDALVAGLLAGLTNLLMMPLYTSQMGSDMGQVTIIIIVNSLFWAGGVGLMVFVASATADSLSRSVWAGKIETLTLTRQGHWLNKPVGLALVRGVALSLILVGAMVLLLVLMPGVPLRMRGYTPLFGVQFSFSEVILVLTQQGWLTILWVQVLLLGLGSLFMRSGQRWIAVLGLTVTLALLSWGPLEPMVRVVPHVWLFTAIVGAGIALAFVRFDALTAGIGLLGSGLIASMQDGALIQASPSGADVLIIAGLLAVTLLVGFVGIRRGEIDTAPYIPAYLAEIAERERLTHELDIAREVQQSFLPKQMPEVEGLDFAAACLAAQDVGGDYYDVARLDERRVGIVIGDVSGKGIHAAFYMTLVKGFVQGMWTHVSTPSDLLRRLNDFFCASAPRGMFISVICGVFDLEDRTFTFARAGHNPLLYKKAGAATADMLQPPGLAVGLVPGRRFDRAIVDETLHLEPGDLFVLYTDGVSEAMDRNRRLYGDDRLLGLLGEQNKKYAWALLGALVADVRAFAGGEDLHDDMTMVIVRVTEGLRRDLSSGNGHPAEDGVPSGNGPSSQDDLTPSV